MELRRDRTAGQGRRLSTPSRSGRARHTVGGPAAPLITLHQARGIALGSMGFSPNRRTAGAGSLRSMIDRLGLLQIDSVSVFARAHTVPLFSRIGPYDPRLLERAARRGGLLTESWAHEAAYVRTDLYPALGFRRRAARTEGWQRVRRAAEADDGLLERIERTVSARGPIAPSAIERELGPAEKPREGWGWRRSETRWAIEYLFRAGVLASVGRTAQFERLLVPVGSALPGYEPDRDDLPETEGVAVLVETAARALGIASSADIRDYFRLDAARVDPVLERLARRGTIERVQVPLNGRDAPMWLHAEAARPRHRPLACLVSPFDPLVFHRRRMRDLFGMEYRLEIYTPAAKRLHGYYCLPFLLGDHLVARVDLKSDRRTSTLRVLAAHTEEAERTPSGRERVARALAPELERAAAWQQLGSLSIEPVGDLAPALAAQEA